MIESNVIALYLQGISVYTLLLQLNDRSSTVPLLQQHYHLKYHLYSFKF